MAARSASLRSLPRNRTNIGSKSCIWTISFQRATRSLSIARLVALCRSSNAYALGPIFGEKWHTLTHRQWLKSRSKAPFQEFGGKCTNLRVRCIEHHANERQIGGPVFKDGCLYLWDSRNFSHLRLGSGQFQPDCSNGGVHLISTFDSTSPVLIICR